MALVEAVLSYRPHRLGPGDPIPIARTGDPHVLRMLRDRLLAEAAQEAEFWRGVDPGLAAMKVADAERLTRVLAVLLPDEELRPELHVVT